MKLTPYGATGKEWMRRTAEAVNAKHVEHVNTKISHAPERGDWDSLLTAYNGNISYNHLTIGREINGADTLGTPSSGYQHNQELAAITIYTYNTSGHNEQTGGNGGRTLGHNIYLKIDNYGQGDFSAITVDALVAGAKPGATSWLANPAASMINGTFTAGAHGVYLNPFETNLELGDKDAAGVGYVVNINRSTGDTSDGLGAFTGSFRGQSTGAFAVDSPLSSSGLFKAGLDLTPMTLTSDKAGIALKQGDRIYLNSSSTDGLKATTYGTTWIERSSSGMDFVVGGAIQFRITSAGALSVNVASIGNYANDAAASAGSVPVGGVYRNGSALMVRVS